MYLDRQINRLQVSTINIIHNQFCLPRFHAVSQVFSAQLYGIEQLYHDQARNREAETERAKRQNMHNRALVL